MSYALAVRPTPLRLFLSGDPYTRRDPDPDVELVTVTERASQVWEHYYDQVTITRRSEVLEEEFYTLAEDWREATLLQSSLSEITAHPAYRTIIDLGEEVVPLLLRELAVRPSLWFTALREITGVNPVRPEDRGRIDKMARAWLRWGKEQHLSW